MPYRAGDEVVVLAINRKGRVVEVVGTRYRVSVGALTMTCREEEIRPVQRERRRGPHRPKPLISTSPEPAPPASRMVRTIDLHGMSVQEAESALMQFVNDALLDGADTIEVVHGLGTGRVRRAALAQLRRIAAIKAIRAHPTNRGVTIAYL